ncbi:hypothetical protein [Vibrio harveyi]|uniref:hypothetical protein n=1 Tax=Vibrio harveyi TaxID=669 RepID=UPI003CF96452
MIWPFTTLRRKQKKIEELEDKIQQLLMDNINIKDWSLNEYNGMDIKLEGSIVHIIAASLVEQFRGHNGINYVDFGFVDKEENQRYSLLMQKVSGLTPTEKATKLEAELAEITAKFNEQKKELEMYRRQPQIPQPLQ